MFRAVKKLSPATIVSIGAGGVSERRYWSGEPAANRHDREQLVEEYRDLFERAVVRQMMSDRPIGVMLSGGVDSGAITAVMAANSSHVRTYTMGFADGGDTNEIDLARETASLFGNRAQLRDGQCVGVPRESRRVAAEDRGAGRNDERLGRELRRAADAPRRPGRA